MPVGTTAAVRVPASSANLGPGFDSIGLALAIHDDVEAEVIDAGLVVEASGEGSGGVPLDERHLVVRAIRHGLRAAGCEVPGLVVRCRNTIPHSRGLGSSAAAVAAGIEVADRLAGGVLDSAAKVQLTADFEGHPDNAAASVLGGAVVSWTETGADDGPVYRAIGIPVDPRITITVLVPGFESSTEVTRDLLPASVPHADAAFNVSRAALLTVALGSRPDLLMEATEDRLHQHQRSEALPVTTAWVRELRAHGHAAVVSGAGPTVLVLGTRRIEDDLLARARAEGLRVLEPGIAAGVAGFA